MKYYLNPETERIEVTECRFLPDGAVELAMGADVTPADYNNDKDGGRNKYIIEDNIVKHRPLTAAEIAEKEAAQAQEQETQRLSKVITPRELRLYLLEHWGVTSAQIEVLLDAKGLIEWEYATVILRSNPLVDRLAAALGKSDADVDTMFNDAPTLYGA